MQIIEPVDEICQDQFAIKELQLKLNEVIAAFNASITPQTPTPQAKKPQLPDNPIDGQIASWVFVEGKWMEVVDG